MSGVVTPKISAGVISVQFRRSSCHCLSLCCPAEFPDGGSDLGVDGVEKMGIGASRVSGRVEGVEFFGVREGVSPGAPSVLGDEKIII